MIPDKGRVLSGERRAGAVAGSERPRPPEPLFSVSFFTIREESEYFYVFET